MRTTRRNFLLKSMAATAGISTTINSLSASLNSSADEKPVSKKGTYSINIFSKNLHWLNFGDMAEVVSEMGFDGVDLTVRPQGHVLPERVTTDLPRAVEVLKQKGLHVYMITTAITDSKDPYTETILKTAASLGIPYYRMGWLSYNDQLSIKENLDIFKDKLTGLALLNKQYGIEGHYQNHSGASFGSPLWDLAAVLKEIKSPWIGSQYDILHATVEGANSWPLALTLLKPYVGSMDIKDFIWLKKDNQWKVEDVPLGDGMVDFKKYFKMIKEYTIEGPFCIHYEYPLGGAENGATTLTLQKEMVLSAMKKDAVTLKKLLQEAGLK